MPVAAVQRAQLRYTVSDLLGRCKASTGERVVRMQGCGPVARGQVENAASGRRPGTREGLLRRRDAVCGPSRRDSRGVPSLLPAGSTTTTPRVLFSVPDKALGATPFLVEQIATPLPHRFYRLKAVSSRGQSASAGCPLENHRV